MELIKTTKPDAALMDIKLIAGSAFDILELLEIRKINIPKIALVSALTDVEYREKAINDYQNTIVYFISRPFVDNWALKLGKAIDAISLAIKSTSNIAIEDSPPPLIPTEVPTKEQTYSLERIQGEYVRINHADIRYLETNGHDKYIYLSDESKHRLTNKTMEDCLKVFTNLIQISKRCAINRNLFSRTCLDDGNPAVSLIGTDKKLRIGEEYKDFIKKLKP